MLVFCYRPGHVSNWNGVAVLLDLDFLKLDELGASGLEVQPTAGLVDTAVVGRAHQEGHEGRRGDGLVRLGATLVAGVRRHLHHGLDLGGPRNYT